MSVWRVSFNLMGSIRLSLDRTCEGVPKIVDSVPYELPVSEGTHVYLPRVFEKSDDNKAGSIEDVSPTCGKMIADRIQHLLQLNSGEFHWHQHQRKHAREQCHSK